MSAATVAPLMILVAGPYRSGTDGDPARIQANVDAMTAVVARALRARAPAGDGRVVRAAADRGRRSRRHVRRIADAAIFHPIAERLLARCDACLRIGGRPKARTGWSGSPTELGKAVYRDIDEVPVTTN